MATVSMLATRPNPVRFLLYTEWFMLISCGSLAVMEMLEKKSLPIQHILILVLLGLMGWVLPNGKPWEKVVYTAIKISLIFYGTLLGYLHILPSLYLIVVIRSCFIFELPGRWAIAGISFLLFLIHKIQYMRGMMPLLDRHGQHQFWMQQLSEMMLFSVSLFFILRFVSTWLSERSMREQLVDAHGQLQQYALQVEDLATMQERNRIARDITDSIRAGAKGYLLKDMPSEDLAQAIRVVYRGYTQMGTGLLEKLMANSIPESMPASDRSPELPAVLTQLTPREREVLKLVALGLRNQDIAQQLYVSEGTIKTHVTHLLTRLNLRNRSQLAIYVHSLGQK